MDDRLAYQVPGGPVSYFSPTTPHPKRSSILRRARQSGPTISHHYTRGKRSRICVAFYAHRIPTRFISRVGWCGSTGESSGSGNLSYDRQPSDSGNDITRAQESDNEEWLCVAPAEHKEPHGELSTYDEDYETTTSLLQEDAGLPSPSQSLGHAVSGGDIGSPTSQISLRSEFSPLETRPVSDTGIVSKQESVASSP